MDFQTSLEWSLEIVQCLEERGMSWPLLFHSAEKGERVLPPRGGKARFSAGQACSLALINECTCKKELMGLCKQHKKYLLE